MFTDETNENGSDVETTENGNTVETTPQSEAETGNENVDTSVDPEVASGESDGEAVPAATHGVDAAGNVDENVPSDNE